MHNNYCINYVYYVPLYVIMKVFNIKSDLDSDYKNYFTESSA